MFFGTIAPYKGAADLVEAVAALGRDDVRLVLVGVRKSGAARAVETMAREQLGSRVSIFGMQPFERVPEFIACADVVAVPQRRTEATVRQMPAKLFDAMAMARPIVATAVSDIPTVLADCGWVVEPDSPTALAGALSEALADPDRAEARGQRARERCVAEYSWNAMDRTLSEVILKLERPR
jgi:glycosyltransferase involved in cell wall biosynthesis